MSILSPTPFISWLIVSTLMAASSKAQADDAPAGGRVFKDLAYVEPGHERQRLDLYLPPAGDRPTPVIVWVHGGGWAGGSKARTPASRMVQAGFAVAAINYRLSQHAIFPAQIHDCKAAIRWLRAHAAEYRLDPKHIGVWGSSAGGHLVALMGTSNGVADLEGQLGHPEQSSDIQAVVDWFGPTDFLTVGPLICWGAIRSRCRSRPNGPVPSTMSPRMIHRSS
jgi:acetyl esterase/lipase